MDATQNYPWGGSGTESDPYLLENETHLMEFSKKVGRGTNFMGKYLKLANSIELTASNWSSIGNDDQWFNGFFDGADNTISNVNLSGEYIDNGFFGKIGKLAVISNLKLKGSMNASPADNTLGLLTGTNYGIIKECSCVVSSAKLGMNASGKKLYAGIIAGINQKGGQIENCTAKGTFMVVPANAVDKNTLLYIGGSTGVNYAGAPDKDGILNCTIDMTGDFTSISRSCLVLGGVTAENAVKAAISGCTLSGSMRCADEIYGLAQINNGSVTNCISKISLAVSAVEASTINLWGGTATGTGTATGNTMTGEGEIKLSENFSEKISTSIQDIGTLKFSNG